MSNNTENELLAYVMNALHFPVRTIVKASGLPEWEVQRIRRKSAKKTLIKAVRRANPKNESRRLARWLSAQQPITRTVLNSFLVEYAECAKKHVLGEVDWKAFMEAYYFIATQFESFGRAASVLDPYYASLFASEFDGKRIRITRCPECGHLRAEFDKDVYGPCMRHCPDCYWFLHSRKYLALRRKFWPFFNRASIHVGERSLRN